MRTSKRFSLIRLAIVIVLVTCPLLVARAQPGLQLKIRTVDSRNFPFVDIRFSVTAEQVFPFKGLTLQNIVLKEDGNSVPAGTLTSALGQPLSVVFVVDVTETMGYQESPERLKNTKDAASRFVNSLPATDQVAIVAFAEEVMIVQELTFDKDRTRIALESLAPQPSSSKNAEISALYQGISMAISLLEAQTEQGVIILITDGRDNDVRNKVSFTDVINQSIQGVVPIYTLGFWGIDRGELEQLAQQTGGTAQILQSSADLISALGETLKQVDTWREQYLLRYQSTLPADHQSHQLIVGVDSQGLYIEQNVAFTAIPVEIKIRPNLQEGQTIGGVVNLAPSFEVPAPPLTSLEILVDGKQQAAITSEPFRYSWNSTNSLGQRRLEFVAYDSAGNVGKVSQLVNVQPGVTTTIKSPALNAVLTEPTLIQAEVSSFAKISKVDFTVDGQVIGTRSDTPYEWLWDIRETVTGPHQLSVLAVDENGISHEAKVNVNVEYWKIDAYLWMALLAGVVSAGILIPVSLRKRRSVAKKGKTVRAAHPAGKTDATADLREIAGQNPNHLWPLSVEEVRLGRRRETNDIHLKGTTASRDHAVIRFYQGHHMIYTLNPNNPVLVNGIPSTTQQVLSPGDTLQVGESIFRYEARS